MYVCFKVFSAVFHYFFWWRKIYNFFGKSMKNLQRRIFSLCVAWGLRYTLLEKIFHKVIRSLLFIVTRLENQSFIWSRLCQRPVPKGWRTFSLYFRINTLLSNSQTLLERPFEENESLWSECCYYVSKEIYY